MKIFRDGFTFEGTLEEWKEIMKEGLIIKLSDSQIISLSDTISWKVDELIKRLVKKEKLA